MRRRERAALIVIPCTTCRSPMRPHKTSTVDYPGTVARHSAEECAPCWRVRTGRTTGLRRDQRGPDGLAEADHTPALRAYLADRRRRGIPPAGLRHGEDA